MLRSLGDLPAIVDELLACGPAQADINRRGAARLAKATEMIGLEAQHYFTKDGTALEPAGVERAMQLLLDTIALQRNERAKSTATVAVARVN